MATPERRVPRSSIWVPMGAAPLDRRGGSGGRGLRAIRDPRITSDATLHVPGWPGNPPRSRRGRRHPAARGPRRARRARDGPARGVRAAGSPGRGGAARAPSAGDPARDRAQLPRPCGRDGGRPAVAAAAVRQARVLDHGAERRGRPAGLHGGARLRGGAGGRHRPDRPRRAGRTGPGPRLRLRGDERPLRARPPARRAPVDPREGRRRLRPVRPLDHHRRRGARPSGAVHPHLGQRRSAPGRHHPRHGLLGRRPHRLLLVQLHPAAR